MTVMSRSERGASGVEYALAIAAMAAVIVVVVVGFTKVVTGVFGDELDQTSVRTYP